MAPVSKNPINAIFSLKNLLISTSIVFMAMILKLCVPIVSEFVVSGVPMFWTTLASWFTPPYLYVVVNVIIIVIAATSRFQQKMDDGVSEMAAPMKIQTDLHKESSVEYKPVFEAMEPPRHWEVVEKEEKTKIQKDLEVKTRKKPVEAKLEFQAMEMSMMYGHMEGKAMEVNTRKKTMESESKFEAMEYGHMEAKKAEVKTKKKLVEFKLEFEVWKPEKYGRIEAKNMEVMNKMAASAKEIEEHAHSKSMGTLERNSIQNPMAYSFSEEIVLGHRELESRQVGKEVRAKEEEENDTLDGTWKMIMERSRIHNAGLQEASMKAEKFKQSNNLRSPSQSRRKQDTFYR